MTPARRDASGPGRWELVRALGAVADTSSAADSTLRILGLGEVKPSAHTYVFVLNCPPYAAIHLGAEGMLGGEGTDRVAGFWSALGLVPPPEPDHLTSLLALYCHLGEACDSTAREQTRAGLTRIRQALLWEHLWSWVPGYARAVTDLGVTSLSPWAVLLREVLAAEIAGGVGDLGKDLPAALRDAPAPLSVTDELGDLLDGLITPLRSGMVISRQTLARATGEVGIGQRIGERRFTLRAMLDQDPAGTLGWLTAEALDWHRYRLGDQMGGPGALTARWWAARAAKSAGVLEELAGLAAPKPHPAERADAV